MLCPGDDLALERLVESIQKKNMMIAEVGSWKGDSTGVLAKAVANFDGKVFAIDHWRGSLGTHTEWEAEAQDIYSIFKYKMIAQGFWDIVHPLVMDSETASKIFADEILDMVFIDADHRYELVKQDIIGWLPKVKSSGILCGHDCEGFYSNYTPTIKRIIDNHPNTDYLGIEIVGGTGCHPGVIKALYDLFTDKYSIMPRSTIWYIKGEQLKEARGRLCK